VNNLIRVRTLTPVYFLIALFLLVGATAVQTASWLDRGISNWNKAGDAVPKIKSSFEARCRSTAREPETVADRQLIAAGWTLFGPVESYSGTAVIHGMASADGMCRPNEFHAFVFVDNRFAGTLTPAPMNARSDGVESRIWLNSATSLSVEFSRYRNSDPLCCPSGKSRKAYTITRTPQGPSVVPDTAPATTESQPSKE
jgi:hypothetical protein